jgi:hypothetical protein
MLIDKFKHRKLSKFYYSFGSKNAIVALDGTTLTNSNSTKLICTTRLIYNRNLNTIYLDESTISTTYNQNLNGGIDKKLDQQLTSNGTLSYCNLYVFQDTVSNGRGIVIEFLSIDAVTVPFNNKINTFTTLPNYKYFVKAKNRFYALNPSSPRVDQPLFTEFVPLGGINTKNLDTQD